MSFSKIGLAVCYKVQNYGSKLQAFATQEMIKKLGYDCECVNYTKKKDVNTFLSYLHTLLIPYVLKIKIGSIKKKIQEKKEILSFGAGFEKRKRKLREFEKAFRTSKPVVGYRNLLDYASNFKVLLVGSDQIWHPLNLGSRFYTLEWGNGQKRIAYAPSFGVSNIPWIQRKRTINYIKNIDFLSCREKKGTEIIKELTGLNAQLVLDPTLLFTADEWDDLLKKPTRVVEQKYIFCYFLGNNPSHRKWATELSRITKTEIVFLPHICEIIPSDRQFGDVQLYDVGPSDFFALIRDADYVCTDSFHGTVFSILNQKKFVTFNRYGLGKGSTNSRIDSLFSLLHVNRHEPGNSFSMDELTSNGLDYSQILNYLAEYRAESISFLKRAIESSLEDDFNKKRY